MATPDPLIGKTLNGYEITRLIGRGGMATVYEARQISMNRFVALKILPRHLIENEQFLQRFHRRSAHHCPIGTPQHHSGL
jgi:serine/threonine-protein kinase